MDAYRKTALTLHGLHEADKQWMLRHLPEHHREQLLPMLDELVDLGIPRHPDVTQSISDSDADDTVSESLAEEEEALPEAVRKLLGAPVEMLHRILTREPASISAAVLLAHDWPWREDLLTAFPEPLKTSVQGTMVRIEGRITEKASETILQILADRCEQPPEALPAESATEPEPAKKTRKWFSFRRS